jgi:hypothetical protein
MIIELSSRLLDFQISILDSYQFKQHNMPIHSCNSFSSSLPFAPFCSPWHFQTCFGSMSYTHLECKGYVKCYKTLGTCYLACHEALGTHNMGGYGAKHWQGEKKNRAKARLRGGNCNRLLVLTAITTMCTCNIRGPATYQPKISHGLKYQDHACMKAWKRSSTNLRLGAIFQKTFYTTNWYVQKLLPTPTQHSCFLNKCQQHKL